MRYEPLETSATFVSGGTELPFYLVAPENGEPRAGVVFFHGGAWMMGSPEQFLPQCRALARAGILAATAGYRLLGSGASSLVDCVDDVGTAIEQFRGVAAGYGLGGDRVVAGGGSAGGHLALVVALTGGAEGDTAASGTTEGGTAEAGTASGPGPERTAPGPVLGGLVLFNPAVDLGGLTGPSLDIVSQATGLSPTALEELSPTHLVRPGCPPTLLFHGTDDEVVPVETVRRFRDRMVEAGNRCELVEFAGAGHGFFNVGPGGNRWFDETMTTTAQFLLELAAAGPP